MNRPEISKQIQSQQVAWWPVVLGSAVIVIVFVALIFTVNWVRSFSLPYEKASGKILEMRKVVLGTTGRSNILYGLQVHVQYQIDGNLQDRWLRASDDLNQDSLEIKLASHPSECLVYWPQDHPENARCSLK